MDKRTELLLGLLTPILVAIFVGMLSSLGFVAVALAETKQEQVLFGSFGVCASLFIFVIVLIFWVKVWKKLKK